MKQPFVPFTSVNKSDKLDNSQTNCNLLSKYVKLFFKWVDEKNRDKRIPCLGFYNLINCHAIV